MNNILSINDIPSAANIYTQYSEYSILDYQKFLDEIKQYKVDLDNDPGAQNLSALNTKIASIDAQKTRVSFILGLAIENENNVEIFSKQLDAIRKQEFNKLLTDNSVKELKSKEMREASAHSTLCLLDDFIRDVDGSYSRAKTFTKLVQTVFDSLEITNRNISRQVTILQLQVEIGEISRANVTTKLQFGTK